MKGLKSILLWGLISVLGAAAFAILALSRGESVNAMWLIVAAVCTYAVAYRVLQPVYRPQSVRS